MSGIDPGSLANELVWLVLATAMMVPAVVLPAVQRLRGRDVGPAWLNLGAVLAASLPTLLGLLLTIGWSDKSADELALATTSFAALRLGAWLTSLPLVALTALVGAFFAFREADDRSWRWVGAVLFACWLVAMGVAVGGVVQGDVLFSAVRAVAYGVLAVPVALGAVSRQPALTMGLFPLGVALGEASHRGMVVLLIGLQTSNVPAELWPEAVHKFNAAVATTQLVGLLAVGVATSFALASAFHAARERPVDAVGPVLCAAASLWIVSMADLGTDRLLSLAAITAP